ncbi:acyl carrier protein [Paenibacillus kobensis]|uniref:acyl carrier protein n=1 Tax=Paenibacillus kobensis TaxID=59841 RepID=UPI000FDA2485|nr:acyl carrier protein [Paenibacillus kobensis]
MESIDQGVRSTLQKITGVSPVEPHSLLREDLGIDSFQFVQLVVELENMLKVRIDDAHLNINCYTDVASLSDYLTEISNKSEGIA